MKDLATIISENKAAVAAYESAKKVGGVVTVNIFVEAEKEEAEGLRFLSVEDYPEVLDSGFEYFSVIVDRSLSLAEVSQVAGAVGYAFRQVLHGESLSEPDVKQGIGFVELTFFYDTTKSQSDDPDFHEAFETARDYIQFGSPVRKTDRSGPGTKGTQLVTGIGEVGLRFYVGAEGSKPVTVRDIGVAAGDVLKFQDPLPVWGEGPGVIDTVIDAYFQSVGTEKHHRFGLDYYKLKNAIVLKKGPGERFK